MKNTALLLVCGFISLLPHNIPAQERPALPARPAPVPMPRPRDELQKFDIDFKGGSPVDLTDAITKALGKPLNVIIKPEDKAVQLPPLKMRNVDVQSLFSALSQASVESKAQATGTYSDFGGAIRRQYQTINTSYGFDLGTPPPANADSIWIFKRRAPTTLPDDPDKICRYFNLRPYIEKQGLKLEDITTAIETGWQMLGQEDRPQFKFHKDTKLLIAVGASHQLKLIDSVLEQLGSEPREAKGTYPAGPVKK